MIGPLFLIFCIFLCSLDVTRRVITLLSGGGLSINGKHIYCGDYIFSGHTMTLTMAYMTIKQCKYHRIIVHYKTMTMHCRHENWYLQLLFLLKRKVQLDIILYNWNCKPVIHSLSSLFQYCIEKFSTLKKQ